MRTQCRSRIIQTVIIRGQVRLLEIITKASSCHGSAQPTRGSTTMRCAATHWVYNNGITCVHALQLWTHTSRSPSVSIPALHLLETLEIGRNYRKEGKTAPVGKGCRHRLPASAKKAKVAGEMAQSGRYLLSKRESRFAQHPSKKARCDSVRL